jgi:translation initiation factor 1A
MPQKHKKKEDTYAAREPDIHECGSGQMYGRVTKLLGGYHVMVYCNDDRERMCTIRGTMRKKVWISVGDMVLISLRECVSSDDKADICARYDPKVIYKLRKIDPSINPKLFVDQNEKMDDASVEDDSNGFVFDEI